VSLPGQPTDVDAALIPRDGLVDPAILILTYGQSGSHVPLVRQLLRDGADPATITLIHNPASVADPGPAAELGVQVERMGSNVGYSAAMNVGLSRTAGNGQMAMLLTHDVRVTLADVRRLVQLAEENPSYGILSAVLHDASTLSIYSAGGYVSSDGLVGHRREVGREDVSGISNAQWVDGSLLLVRRDAVAAAGSLDERFFMYFEETDLCRRIRAAGWQIGVAVNIHAETAPGHNTRLGAYSFLFSRNGLEYALRAYGLVGVAKWSRRRMRELRSAVRRAIRSRRAEARYCARLECVGTALGFAAFVTRRWGPPPRWLPGQGDIAAVRRRAHG
jgi:GT2 family glycosyltransferase